MNYFELYELPVSFHPDQGAVKQIFYKLSKKYHPDFFINESEEKQQEVLERSTLNNKAYAVLSNPAKTLQYVLQLKEQLPEGENYPLPQSFLMEMMDINEGLMELEFEPNVETTAKLCEEVKNIHEKLHSDVCSLTKNFNSLEETEQSATLLKIKDLYYRQKYVARLQERLKK